MGPDSAFDSLSRSVDLAVPAIKNASYHPAGSTVIMSPWRRPGIVGFFRPKPIGVDQESRKS
jgi:hypothetical protein